MYLFNLSFIRSGENRRRLNDHVLTDFEFLNVQLRRARIDMKLSKVFNHDDTSPVCGTRVRQIDILPFHTKNLNDHALKRRAHRVNVFMLAIQGLSQPGDELSTLALVQDVGRVVALDDEVGRARREPGRLRHTRLATEGCSILRVCAPGSCRRACNAHAFVRP